jgi:hypothetical protein
LRISVAFKHITVTAPLLKSETLFQSISYIATKLILHRIASHCHLK